MQNRDRFGPERYYILRYEDLTRSPEEHLQKLKTSCKSNGMLRWSHQPAPGTMARQFDV